MVSSARNLHIARRVMKGCCIAALMVAIAETVAAAPVAPVALNVTVVGDTVTLSWLHPEAGNVQFSLEAGTAPSLSNAAVLLTRERSYTATAVPAGTYYVRVRAFNADGIGPPSNEVTVRVTGGGPVCTSPPDAPQGFLSLVSEETGIRFEWLPETGICIPTGYVMQVGSTSGASNLATLVVGPGFSFDYDVPTGVYYVRLIATNRFGASAPSNEVRIDYVRCVQPPNAPRLVATAVAGTNVTLIWQRPTGGCNPVDYLIVAGTAAGRSDLGSVRVGNTVSFTGSVPPGTYFVRVVAIGLGGAGVPSNEGQLVVR